MLDVYEFCSNDLKKQLDGPRVAVREEEDRKANKDRAAKKAKMVSSFLHGFALHCSRPRVSCSKGKAMSCCTWLLQVDYVQTCGLSPAVLPKPALATSVVWFNEFAGRE